MIKLILPSIQHWASFQKGLQDFKKNPTLYDINEVKKGFDFECFEDYHMKSQNDRLGIDLQPGYVPSTCLWLIKDDEFIGVYNLRHALTENLKKRGGHIAYAIVPSKRKQGYGVLGLKLCCSYALQKLHLQEVLVTCNASNIPSYKTMLKVMNEWGGHEDTPVIFEDFVENRVWIKTQIFEATE